MLHSRRRDLDTGKSSVVWTWRLVQVVVDALGLLRVPTSQYYRRPAFDCEASLDLRHLPTLASPVQALTLTSSLHPQLKHITCVKEAKESRLGPDTDYGWRVDSNSGVLAPLTLAFSTQLANSSALEPAQIEPFVIVPYQHLTVRFIFIV